MPFFNQELPWSPRVHIYETIIMKHIGILVPLIAVVISIASSGILAEFLDTYDTAFDMEETKVWAADEEVEIVSRPIEVSSSNPDSTPFLAEIEEGRSKVNVRATPPQGKVVKTVDGGTPFVVSEVRHMSEPIYLLKEPISLIDEFSGNLVERAANSQLQIISDEGRAYLVDVEDDHGAIVRIMVPKSKVAIRYDSWYYSENLDGWVFSGLCTVLN